MRHCVICGRPFAGIARRLTCSPACAALRAAKAKREWKVCHYENGEPRAVIEPDKETSQFCRCGGALRGETDGNGQVFDRCTRCQRRTLQPHTAMRRFPTWTMTMGALLLGPHFYAYPRPREPHGSDCSCPICVARWAA